MRRRIIAGALTCVAALLAAGCMPSLDRGSDDVEPVAEELPRVPVVVVLDASGSMKAEDAPGQRFAAAQDAVRSLVKVLSGEHEIGLTVYGTSTGSSDEEQAAGCKDIKRVVPFGPLDKKAFTAAVDGLKPSGYTPIGSALTDAADQLPGSGKRAIVLVSDGVDTCAPPDPCDVAEDLHERDPDLVVHTVAFRVADDPAAREQLSCIADAGGGLDLDASSGALLSTRLLAAFDPARAANSLQPSGYRGLVPGMTVDQAREAAPKLPRVDPEGRVEIVYIDCTLVFEDGVLTEIVPKGKKIKTLDGIGIGDDIAEAEKIYGEPDLPSRVSEDESVTYTADQERGTGYRITFEPEQGGDTLRGTIIRIVLCRCSGAGTRVVALHPLTSDGSISNEYTVDSSEVDSLLPPGYDEFDVITATVSPSMFGLAEGTYSVGTTATNAGACWGLPSKPGSVVCATGPWSTTLREFHVIDDPSVHPYDRVDVIPYGVELADGSRWEARIGGAWGSRADGWNGAYYCVDRCVDDSLVILFSGTTRFEVENGQSYAYLGALGEPDEHFPPPERIAVTEVRFIE